MYGQLSSAVQARVTKEQFISKYRSIYAGIEADHVKIKPIFPSLDPEKPGADSSELTFSYQLDMDTFLQPISFKGSATMVKEETQAHQGWYVAWNPTFIFPEMAEGDKVRASTFAPKRGTIMDRGGHHLATDKVVVDVCIVPRDWQTAPQGDQQKLLHVLATTSEALASMLQASSANPDSPVRLATLPEEDTRLALLANVNGVTLRKKEVRYYPFKEAFAHLIGYVGPIDQKKWEALKEKGYTPSDLIGKAGLEQLYEDELRGSGGGIIKINDASGALKKVIAEKPATNGKTIALTVDATLQQTIYEQMKQDEGAASALDPKTGEVLALVSTPSYDPNAFVQGMTAAQWKQLSENPHKPLLNRFAHAYAPGSTFKPLTASIGLVTKTLVPEEKLDIQGLHWQKDRSWGNYTVTRVSDSHAPVDLERALIYSDNIYFAQAALAMGQDGFLREAERFGFGEPLPFPYPLEASSLVKGGMKSEIQLADSGYGQGEVTMTPLHLALAYTSFVNGGSIVAPTLLQGADTDIYWKKAAIPADVAAAVKADLVQVMENPHGTGHKARVPGYVIAGKTGTAEMKQRKGDLGKENGWYVAFQAEEGNPNLLVAMMIEDVRGRGGSHYLDPKIRQVFTVGLQLQSKQ